MIILLLPRLHLHLLRHRHLRRRLHLYLRLHPRRLMAGSSQLF